MGNIEYRKANIDDCYAIAELKGVVWNTTYKGIYSDETLANYDIERNERTFRQIVNNPDIEMYVAIDNGRIIGFMTCGKPYKMYKLYAAKEMKYGLRNCFIYEQ